MELTYPNDNGSDFYPDIIESPKTNIGENTFLSSRIGVIFMAIFFSLFLFSCSKPGQVTIKGTITNSLTNKVYLDKLGINETFPFDSTSIGKDGEFTLKSMVNQPTFFLLRLGDQRFITLLLDSAERVALSADFINFSSDYEIKGSPGSEKVLLLNRHLMRTNASLDSLQSLLNLQRGDADFDAKRNVLLDKMNALYNKQQEFSNKFILENPFSLASVLAIYQKFSNGNYVVQDLQTIKVAASALYSMYPNSEHAKTLYEDAKTIMKNVKNQQLQAYINQVGVNSPDISLPDVSGREVKLSSLRGKYVLLHFWSAFDATSRIMNPVLKENYKEFKNKGFEIYQVSIDTTKQAWVQAIERDQLTWTNVGDMNGSNVAVANYNVQMIPFNYLLDPEGKIIARDLKGPALHRKLSEILN